MLMTILRNQFRSQYRKQGHEVEDVDGHYAETLKSDPEQPATRIRGIPHRSRQTAFGTASGLDPGGRFESLLRRGRGTMRRPCRHH